MPRPENSESSDEHRRFDGMAVQHVLGGLSEEKGRLFRAHLLECLHCRARVGELRALAHDLADVERDEARLRAAKRIETKRREEIDEEAPPVARPSHSRRSQAGVVVLLVAVILLGGWNFFLRSTVADLEESLEVALEASRTVDAGRAWTVDSEQGVEADVHESNGALVLNVQGLEDGEYELEVQDGAGATLETYPAEPTDGSVSVLVDVDGDADELVLLTAAQEPVLQARTQD